VKVLTGWQLESRKRCSVFDIYCYYLSVVSLIMLHPVYDAYKQKWRENTVTQTNISVITLRVYFGPDRTSSGDDGGML
jgi:hypothetical protein